MFIFMSRKRSLIKKLLKQRKNEARQQQHQFYSNNNEHQEQENASSCVAALLKKLQDKQLEMLLTAIDSRGADRDNCVLVPKDFEIWEPHVLCCRAWRWPDIQQANELRRLPTCRSSIDPVYICCNPYHWSRLFAPGTPPPAYSRTNIDRIKPEDRAPSEMPLLTRDSCESLTTNGESSTINGWCRLAYWELNNRVGPFFPVESMAVNVFGEIRYGQDGLNLENLATANCRSSADVVKARSKIGLGVTIAREDGCVWVYNRSDQLIFVNSFCLDDSPHCARPTRVPADYCLCVYDPIRAQANSWNVVHPQMGPIDQNSIRISFLKGWGQTYSRREITLCPCWIEILLAPCR